MAIQWNENTGRIAIIDMGTNTFHLLLAEIDSSSIKILLNEVIPVRLGAMGITRGEIAKEAQVRGLKTLEKFKIQIDKYNVKEVHAFATSAVRNAANASEFLDSIIEHIGIVPQVIDGNQEADFIFQGVSVALKLPDQIHLIVDIGGGSNECIISDSKKIIWKKSFEVGAQRLKDKFHLTDPIENDHLLKLYKYLDDQMEPLKRAMSKHNPEVLIGCSGTFNTLSDIYESRNALETTRGKPEGNFELDSFGPIFEELKIKNYKQRLLIPGMVPIRAEMIVMATGFIKWLINNHTFAKLRISHYAMKEGILNHFSKLKLNMPDV